MTVNRSVLLCQSFVLLCQSASRSCHLGHFTLGSTSADSDSCFFCKRQFWLHARHSRNNNPPCIIVTNARLRARTKIGCWNFFAWLENWRRGSKRLCNRALSASIQRPPQHIEKKREQLLMFYYKERYNAKKFKARVTGGNCWVSFKCIVVVYDMLM